MTTLDCLNTSETISFRIAAALRERAIETFVGSLTREEMTSVIEAVPSAYPLMGEQSRFEFASAFARRCEDHESRGHNRLADLASEASDAFYGDF